MVFPVSATLEQDATVVVEQDHGHRAMKMPIPVRRELRRHPDDDILIVHEHDKVLVPTTGHE